MDGREFLLVARELALGATEAHWRSAVGRADYALFLGGLAALERWGFARPPRHQVHAFVRLRFTYASDSDLRRAGKAIDDLVQRRNEADYQIAFYGSFADAAEANRVIREAESNLALLDQVEAD